MLENQLFTLISV